MRDDASPKNNRPTKVPSFLSKNPLGIFNALNDTISTFSTLSY